MCPWQNLVRDEEDTRYWRYQDTRAIEASQLKVWSMCNKLCGTISRLWKWFLLYENKRLNSNSIVNWNTCLWVMLQLTPVHTFSHNTLDHFEQYNNTTNGTFPWAYSNWAVPTPCCEKRLLTAHFQTLWFSTANGSLSQRRCWVWRAAVM